MNDMIPDARNFKRVIDGKDSDLFILKNRNGATAAISNYGGRIVGLKVPDKNGSPTDVVMGFNSLAEYQSASGAYFGAIIGRFGNRIRNGKFTLDGIEYNLAKNNGTNTLHGGIRGFHAVVWNARMPDESSIELSYLSQDMEEGFPGNLDIDVVYTLLPDNALKCSYIVTTDKKTVINLTNHAYFNLNGENSGTILNHKVMIFADRFTPVDRNLIPTGELASVVGTPFDFRKETSIGSRIVEKDIQLFYGNGYDHNFVLNKESETNLTAAAVVTGDKSGIRMEVFTEEPGMQFYTGSKIKMAGNIVEQGRSAFAMETQHFPDSPNQPSFPSTELNPGDVYRSTSIYKFSTEDSKGNF